MSGIIQDLVVCSDTKKNLELALQLAMSWHPKVYGMKSEDNVLTLYWHEKGGGALPVGLPVQGVVPLVWQWLKENERWKGPHAPQEPDIDGSVVHGWHLKSFDDCWSYAICKIRPEYTEYSK